MSSGSLSSDQDVVTNGPNTVNNIDFLPDEVLLNIFSLLSIEDILVCEKVSQRWKILAQDPCIWRHLVIIYNGRLNHNQDIHRSLQILKSHGQYICRVKVQYVHDYCTLKSILVTCHKSNLISLELVMCKIFKDFEEDLKVWKNLRRLSLKNSILHTGEDDLTIPYAQYKDLTFLELSQFGLTRMNCRALAPLQHLCHINIDKITDLNYINILRLIYAKTDILKSLHIYGGKQIEDFSLELLSKCPNLTSLSIKYCNNLTDVGLCSLINLKKLKHLQIWNNYTFSEQCLLGVLGDPVMFDLNLLSLSNIANITPTILDIINNNYRRLLFLALYCCPKIIDIDIEKKLKEKFKDLKLING